MPYVSTAERVGKREGIRETIKRYLPEILQLRFGAQGREYGQTLREVDDIDKLNRIHQAASDSRSFDEFLQSVR